MKEGKNLGELAQELERRAAAKKDYLATTPTLRMHADGELAIKGYGTLPINAHAHGQLAAYCDIPKAYYERCMAHSPRLLSDNVNEWLETKPNDRRMVRTLDGNVRAFLSDAFRPLENEDLGEALLPTLLDLDLLIVSCELTDKRMYIKCVDKSIEKAVPTGRKMGDGTHTIFDMCCPAITVSNSEVGAGRLLVEGGVYNKGCTNLAMMGPAFKKHHVGSRADISEDVYAMLSDDTRRLSDAAIWAQVRDVIKGAFERAKFEALCDKLGAAAEDRIEGDPVEVVEVFGRKNAIQDGTRKSILRHLIEGADLSRYGLHSAITRASSDVEDYDTATELERLGGQVIELGRKEWRELSKA